MKMNKTTKKCTYQERVEVVLLLGGPDSVFFLDAVIGFAGSHQ
jgi:hypothetical protein